MRSRSARCWSRASAEAVVLTIALAASLPGREARATVFVQPANFNSGSAQNGTGYVANPSFSNGGISYYATTGLTGGAFPDSKGGSGLLDITRTQVSEGGSLANAIQLNVLSDNANLVAPAGNILVLSVTASSATGTSSARQVPIAGENGQPCGGGATCYKGWASPPIGTNGAHSYAVAFFPGQIVTIHVYPKDICADYAGQNPGFVATGCDSSSNTAVANGAGVPLSPPLQLTLNVTSLDPSGTFAAAAALDTGAVNLNFQKDSPQFNCPGDMSSIYSPGDGQITLNGTGFSLPQNPGLAPLQNLVVVGTTKAATPDLTQAGIHSNELVSASFFGDQEHISGIVNKTSETDTAHDYNLAFLVKDAAGLLQPTPTGGGTCKLGPVETSAIQGFLSQSKCFIATAAFRSIGSAPVAMLREFRDRVLLATSPGRAFTRAYYRYSPAPAEWLMRHPQLRQPVLLALVPLELAAWLLLHPAFLAIPLALFLFALALAPRAASRRTEW